MGTIMLMENNEFTTQKDIINNIDEMLEKYQNKTVRNVLAREYKVGKEYGNPAKVSMLCKLVSETLKRKGAVDYSEVTVWRYTKIKEESPELCTKVRSGELKIKQAFELLNRRKPVCAKPESIKEETFIREEIDFDNLTETIKKYREEVIKRKAEIRDKDLKTINNELFEIRKIIGKEMAERIVSEDDNI